METGKQVRLTAAEITSLWASYMNDSGISCKLKYFLSTVEDEEIKPLIKHGLELAQGNVKTLAEIFNKEKYPIP